MDTFRAKWCSLRWWWQVKVESLAILTQRYFVGNQPMENNSYDRDNHINDTYHFPPKAILESEDTNTRNEQEEQRYKVTKVSLGGKTHRIFKFNLHYSAPPSTYNLGNYNLKSSSSQSEQRRTSIISL